MDLSVEEDLELTIGMMDGLFDGAVMVGPAAEVLYINKSFLKTLAWPARKTKRKMLEEGLNLFDWVHERGSREELAFDKCMRKATPATLAEVPVRHGDDSEGVYQVSFAPVTHLGEVLAVMLVYRNVNDEVELQRGFRALLEKERQRADTLAKLVEERTAELEEALEKMSKLSRIDSLTGLLNRRAFFDTVEPSLSLIERHQRRGAVMMCDLDHFKSLNDTYGHQAGDVMLVEVSRVLGEAVRKEDVVCRFGGEEFVVFLSEVTPEGAEITAERILKMVEGLPYAELISGKDRPQTMSMGVAMVPDHGVDLNVLIAKADEALYVAKEGGRNRFVMA